jgi:pyridinium-3,5-bisthiocarboxylic acid mononucleotide nickel chelatase
MSPEIYSYLFPLLLEKGALDMYITPIYMKKNRPGHILSVLCSLENRKELTRVLFSETSTLGIRVQPVERETLERRHTEVTTPWGVIRIKEAGENGNFWKAAPEYEDCARIARIQNVPLREVYETALRVYSEGNHGE